MRVLVTGGTGLLGRAIVRRLSSEGMAVAVFARRPANDLDDRVVSFSGDVTDEESLRSAFESFRPSRVLHLASLLQFDCERNPREAVRVNINGMQNVLNACERFAVERVVFGSSVAVYGGTTKLAREDDPFSSDVNVYGMTKRLSEILGQRSADLTRVQFVALRYVGIFGPGSSHSSGMALVREKLLRCVRGEDVVIDEASGDERVHLTYVSDAVEATIMAIKRENHSYSIYNVAGPLENHLSLKDFYEVIRDTSPGAGAVQWRGVRGKNAGPLDITRQVEGLGYVPMVTVKSGLERMLAS